MARKRETPGAKAYFDAVRSVFGVQAEILTAVLPHMGERGRNDEDRFRDFLAQVLPRKYGIGTGFVLNSVGQTSRQSDIVIFDEVQNAPLHREAASFVFPVEMVYATIEVKGSLRPGGVKDCLRNLESVRALAKQKRYFTYRRIVERESGGGIAVGTSYPDVTAPRAFVVIYDAGGWKSVGSFAKSFVNGLANSTAHVHGVLAIKQGWFLKQFSYTKNEVKLKTYTKDALLRFHSRLLYALQSFQMAPAFLSPYYDLVSLGDGIIVSRQRPPRKVTKTDEAQSGPDIEADKVPSEGIKKRANASGAVGKRPVSRAR